MQNGEYGINIIGNEEMLYQCSKVKVKGTKYIIGLYTLTTSDSEENELPVCFCIKSIYFHQQSNMVNFIAKNLLLRVTKIIFMHILLNLMSIKRMLI